MVPNRNIDVNVRRAIQRIKQQQEATFRIAVGDRVGVIHFRRHRRQVATPFVGFQQDIVGDHVEFFCASALNIAGAGTHRENARQFALVDGVADCLAGARAPTSIRNADLPKWPDWHAVARSDSG